MEMHRRAQIQRSLSNLAQYYVASMKLLEETAELLREEFALDRLAYFKRHTGLPPTSADRSGFRIDSALLSVTFHDKNYFLGNTLPFKLLSY